MNIIIRFESGQMITVAGCAGFEVHAGGDICVLRKNDGSKITYNFRKILYICEDRALEGVSVSGDSAAVSGSGSGGSDMSGAVTGRSDSGGSVADGSGSGSSAASGTGTSRRKSASGKK